MNKRQHYFTRAWVSLTALLLGTATFLGPDVWQLFLAAFGAMAICWTIAGILVTEN